MDIPLARPSARPVILLLAGWALAVAASWVVPAALALEPPGARLAFLAFQVVAAALAVAAAAATLRRRVDLSRRLFALGLLPALWAVGVALWVGAQLYLAS
jgi:hypothetical protein